MKMIPFRSEHLKLLRLQPAQAWMQPMVDDANYAHTLRHSDSYTAVIEDEVVAVVGLFTIWPGRAHLSALLSDRLGSAFILLHREALKRLEATTIRRIEATVDEGFTEGHRWMTMLGFHLETPLGMKGYMPGGGTSHLYARVR